MDIFYPLEVFSKWLVCDVFFLADKTNLAESLNFFVFDTIKIFILLAIIIFVVSLIRTFLPPERIRHILSRKNKYLGNILAAVLGIFTPFCTCSAIPLFLGFLEAGVPLGVTFSFLVSSPMINEVALILLLSTFGWKIALIYIVSGLLIAVFSGIFIGKLKVENLVESFIFNNKINFSENKFQMSQRDRVDYAKNYTLGIIKKVWLYILIGVGLGSLIHGYAPANFLANYVGADKWYAVLVAVLIGIPLYSNTAGIIPLVSVLVEKGVAIGTSLAFMMAVTALSLPEFLILKRVMKVKLILIFASVVGLGIIFTGYLFNLVLK